MGTITKALELLNWFTPNRPEIGLGEFVRLTQRDKATVHRHLVELAENGFLEQNPDSRAYRLGPALIRLANLRESLFPVRRLLTPIVTELSQTLGELAHASLLQDGALSPLVHADPKLHGVHVHFDISEILPLHATSSGIATLAFASENLRKKVLSQPLSKHASRTVSDPVVLQKMLDDARRFGLCTLTGSFDEDVGSVGAPVFTEGNRVIGALAVAIPTARSTPNRLREIARHVLYHARRASVALGGDFPTRFADLPPDWGTSRAETSKTHEMTEPHP